MLCFQHRPPPPPSEDERRQQHIQQHMANISQCRHGLCKSLSRAMQCKPRRRRAVLLRVLGHACGRGHGAGGLCDRSSFGVTRCDQRRLVCLAVQRALAQHQSDQYHHHHHLIPTLERTSCAAHWFKGASSRQLPGPEHETVNSPNTGMGMSPGQRAGCGL